MHNTEQRGIEGISKTTGCQQYHATFSEGEQQTRKVVTRRIHR